MMDYARQQRDPTRHVIGILFVLAFHALLIWGLMTGLARKAVEVIKKPLTATIIEEIKLPPPPPPPPKKIIEAPKVQQPVQTYVPPPDIPVPAPVEAPPVITAVTPTPPVEPPVIAPPPPPVVAVAPPAPPAVRRGASLVVISREDPVYPRDAIKKGVAKGAVVARILIDEKGNVTEVQIVSADPPRVFDNEVRRALALWKFKAEGDKYVGEITIDFTLQ